MKGKYFPKIIFLLAFLSVTYSAAFVFSLYIRERKRTVLYRESPRIESDAVTDTAGIEAWFHGTVIPPETSILIAPLSGKECIFYSYTRSRRYWDQTAPTAIKWRWETLEHRSELLDITIALGERRYRLDREGVSAFGTQTVYREEEKYREDFLDEEYVIEPNAPVWVYGTTASGSILTSLFGEKILTTGTVENFLELLEKYTEANLIWTLFLLACSTGLLTAFLYFMQPKKSRLLPKWVLIMVHGFTLILVWMAVLSAYLMSSRQYRAPGIILLVVTAAFLVPMGFYFAKSGYSRISAAGFGAAIMLTLGIFLVFVYLRNTGIAGGCLVGGSAAVLVSVPFLIVLMKRKC